MPFGDFRVGLAPIGQPGVPACRVRLLLTQSKKLRYSYTDLLPILTAGDYDWDDEETDDNEETDDCGAQQRGGRTGGTRARLASQS